MTPTIIIGPMYYNHMFILSVLIVILPKLELNLPTTNAGLKLNAGLNSPTKGQRSRTISQSMLSKSKLSLSLRRSTEDRLLCKSNNKKRKKLDKESHMKFFTKSLILI